MDFKKICHSLNIVSQCKKYYLPLWQCPHFIFLILGLIIILSSLLSYFFGNRYLLDPLLVALITLFLSAILFSLGFVFIRGFEKLAEANRLKSEFVGVVSHQLRSPLSNLRWVLEMIISGRTGSLSERQVEYLKILKENSDLMDDLLKDLLIVSEIEMGMLPLKKEEFSLENLVDSVIEEFEPFAKASNVEILFEKEGNLPNLFADRSKIKLVVENLLDNAIRYTRGKGKVKISLRKEKNKIYFEVKDEGVGIPKEEQKYILQKFFRAGNVLRFQTRGTGLGLYISKNIVEKSGGRIGFKSQEGKGSKFWFYLPIKKS